MYQSQFLLDTPIPTLSNNKLKDIEKERRGLQYVTREQSKYFKKMNKFIISNLIRKVYTGF